MESIETRTSPKVHYKYSTGTLPRAAHFNEAAEESSDSDSDVDASPQGDTFITR